MSRRRGSAPHTRSWRFCPFRSPFRPDAAKPTSASQSDTSGHAGVGPAPTGPAAAPLPPRARPLTAIRRRRRCYVTSEGVSSRPPSLLVPQAVLLDGGDGAVSTRHKRPLARPVQARPVPMTMSAQLGHGTCPGDEADRRAVAAIAGVATKAPGDAAQPSPIAVAAAPDTTMPAATIWRKTGRAFQPRPPVMRSVRGRAALMDYSRPSRSPRSSPACRQGSESRAHPDRNRARTGVSRQDRGPSGFRTGRASIGDVRGRDREALDALRTDARTLERALSEAGVKTDSASLDFGLREHGAGTGDRFSTDPPARAASGDRRSRRARKPGRHSRQSRPRGISRRRGRLDIRA